MAADVYRQVADNLNRMPNGFPATDSGVELKLLQLIFPDPQDAADWLKFSLSPEPLESLAVRFNRTRAETKRIIDRLVAKDLVCPVKSAAKMEYCILPFFNGLWETMRTPGKLTREFAELWEDYFPHFAKTYGGFAPAQNRVIPVQRTIRADNIIYPYDDVRQIIEKGKSFKISPCMCRLEKQQLGDPCPKDHATQVCLSISTEFDQKARARGIRLSAK